MLSRLQRSLASLPSRVSRHLSTTTRAASEVEVASSSSSSRASEIAPVRKNNGLSYAGLPDSQVVLDLPPEQDPLIRYLASSLLRDGRRHTAEKRASRVLLYLHTLTRAQPLDLFRQAVQKVMPAVRVARHRQSAKDIQIPIALTEKQQVRHAVKWMLKASETRGGRTVEERLAREIVLVLNGSSAALKQKEAQHALAMVNRGNIPIPRGFS